MMVGRPQLLGDPHQMQAADKEPQPDRDLAFPVVRHILVIVGEPQKRLLLPAVVNEPGDRPQFTRSLSKVFCFRVLHTA